MNFTIGYPIYNKGHMIDEIINGLNKNLPEEYDFQYIFIFDGCTDNSEEIFNLHKHRLKGDKKIIKTNNLFQLKTNNILMDEFDTDFLIIFQDDMVLTDSNFIGNIIKIYNLYQEKLGIIGCRDGFEESFTNMQGSEFSESKRTIIKSGEFFEKSMINIGPIILTKNLIKIVGKFDEIYGKGGYEEVEYALKCKYTHNLNNILLGIDLIHSKFENKNTNKISHTSNQILSNQIGTNLNIFRERWYKYAKI